MNYRFYKHSSFKIAVMVLFIFVLTGCEKKSKMNAGEIVSEIVQEEKTTIQVDYQSEIYTQENIQTISASSTLEQKYNVENIIDNTWRSWAEGVNGSGIGESITFTFKTETPVSGFYLRNGYGSLNYYLKNNRVKEFEIIIDNTRQIISIEDTPDSCYYKLDSKIACKTITFRINSVYKGTDYDDTCINEIDLFGRNQYYFNEHETFIFDAYTAKLIYAVYKGYHSNVRINEDNQVEIEYENYDPTQWDDSGKPIPPTYWTGVPMVLEGGIYFVRIPGIGDHLGDPVWHYKIILVENSTPILNVTRSVGYPSGEFEKETSTWKFIDDDWKK